MQKQLQRKIESEVISFLDAGHFDKISEMIEKIDQKNKKIRIQMALDFFVIKIEKLIDQAVARHRFPIYQ